MSATLKWSQPERTPPVQPLTVSVPDSFLRSNWAGLPARSFTVASGFGNRSTLRRIRRVCDQDAEYQTLPCRNSSSSGHPQWWSSARRTIALSSSRRMMASRWATPWDVAWQGRTAMLERAALMNPFHPSTVQHLRFLCPRYSSITCGLVAPVIKWIGIDDDFALLDDAEAPAAAPQCAF